MPSQKNNFTEEKKNHLKLKSQRKHKNEYFNTIKEEIESAYYFETQRKNILRVKKFLRWI